MAKKRMTQTQLDNLVKFKPGESGNPNGRKKGKMLTTILRDRLEGNEKVIMKGVELLDENNKPTGKKVNVIVPMTTKDRIVIALLNKARAGDIRALEAVFNRIDGAPNQNIEAEINLTGGIEHEIDWSKVPTDILLKVRQTQNKQ